MAQPVAAAPKTIAGMLAPIQRVFDFAGTGWVVMPGVAMAVPGVVSGMSDISVGQGKIILRFTLSLGGFSIPARVEIGPEASSFIVDPAFRMQMAYTVPYWDTLMSLLGGRETPITGTEYHMTLPSVSASSPVLPSVSYSQDATQIVLRFPAPYPKVGSGMMWAYVRAVTLDRVGCSLDIYRPVLGFDLAKNPRFVWGA